MSRFLERYHPDQSKDLKEQSKQRRVEFSKLYLQELEQGLYDEVTFEAVASNSEATESAMDEDEKTSMVEDINQEKEEEPKPIETVGDSSFADHKPTSTLNSLSESVLKLSKDLQSFAPPALVIKSIPETAKRADLLEVRFIAEFFKLDYIYSYLMQTVDLSNSRCIRSSCFIRPSR